MINLIKSVWGKLKSLLTIKPQCISTNTTKELRKLNNSCALTALSRVMPNLSYDEISDAFYNCCENWPAAGVTNKEFNIILRYLKIINRFKYSDSNDLTIGRFYKRNVKHTIVLIHGHFTVLHQRNIYDSYGYSHLSNNTKVYASWSLIS